MKQCLGCRGLVPEALTTCPNCAVQPRSGAKVLMAAAGLVTLVATGCIATPVYGIACTAKQLDGGTHGCFGECTTLLEDGGVPARDPSDICYKADGGTP